jgi:hypothetical protein
MLFKEPLAALLSEGRRVAASAIAQTPTCLEDRSRQL